MATATRTLNPLPFQDLEPRRFEDLVRQLAYDFKPWRKLEATGRSGGAWMADRHFLRRADCQIDKGPGLVMAQDLQGWLDEQAPKMRGGNVMLNYAQNTIGSSRRL